MNETFVCEICGQEYPSAQRTEFDGQELCQRCLETHTVTCQECGELIWADDNAGSNGHPLCQNCYDDLYTHCSRCGALLREASAFYLDHDDGVYCESCFDLLSRSRVVHDYSYKPKPIFYGEGKRFMGVELEIDEGGESHDKAAQIMDVANRNGLEHLYVKHDGSLDDGLELVSHPMTLDYHRNEMPWAAILREAVRLGYYSHQTHTCGLHVHVNRSAFGDTQAEQDDVIARILFFVENHWNELLRFSRRTASQMERWAARYGRKDDPKAVLDHAKKNQFERYTCVNLTNYNTIEFRLFRGTLKLNTFLATLQMVGRICDVALFLSDQEIQTLTWSDFVVGCTAPELVQYLKERRPYVNEPVEGEGEV